MSSFGWAGSADRAESQAATVAFVVPTMVLGGAEHQVYMLMKNLDPTRWRPLLITMNEKGPFFERAVSDGFEARCLGVRTKVPIASVIRLFSVLRSERVSVVLSLGFNATFLARLAGIAARVPVLLVAEHASTALASWGRLHRVLDRLLMPFTSAFIAVAGSQVEYLVRERGLPPEKVRVIYNGLDYAPYLRGSREEARGLLGLPAKAFVVGIVALLRREKNHVLFLQAAELMAEELPTARFAIVGDGSERAAIERAVAESAVAQRVTVYGTRRDVECLLPGFDVFALTSITETFPMAILEAMGAGLPVVATRVGGLPEIVRHGETGLLVDAQDAQGLADAWLALARDPERRSAMGAAGRAAAIGRFSAAAMARAHEELFHELLSGR